MSAGRKGFQDEAANADALHFFNRVPGLKKLVAEGIAASFGDGDFVPGSVRAAEPRDVRPGEAREVLDFFECEQRLQLQVIGLRKFVRLQNAVRQIAIVGEKDKPRGMVLETTDRENPLRNGTQKF